MKGTFRIENVEDVEATLTLTMPIREWISLDLQLQASKYPSWKISAVISDMVAQAKKQFIGNQETRDH